MGGKQADGGTTRVAGEPRVRRIPYRDLIQAVSRRADLGFDEARTAVTATVTALVLDLDAAGCERLLRRLPTGLVDADAPFVAPGTLAGFLGQVAVIVGKPPERARYGAQAALSALEELDPALVRSLDLPRYLRGLIEVPRVTRRQPI